MEYLKQVQVGIDYIEANLDFDIRLDNVARQAGLSQWHFQRIFKALTNETLKTYIRSRRLANSMEKLLTTQSRILDIAISAGYESQESFTRAFKKAFELTPKEYRKLGDRRLFLKKVEFDSDYLRHINSNISLEPELYIQRPMKLVGMKTLFYGIDSDKNNIAEKLPLLWTSFMERLEEIENRVPGACYGVVIPAGDSSEQLEYYASIEVSESDSAPLGLTSFDIPLTNYVKFAHRGEVKFINNTVNYIYSSWLLNSKRRHSGGADIEIYGSEYDPVSADSVIHYAIPIE